MKCPACDISYGSWYMLVSHIDEHHMRHAPNWGLYRSCFCGEQWKIREPFKATNAMAKHLKEINSQGRLKAHAVLWALAQ